MVLSELDQQLVAEIQSGLPLCSRPYAVVAERLGIDEQQVIARIEALRHEGTIKRMGIVVRHRELGYRANAMVVWDVPDAQLDDVGDRLGQHECVTLCYHRPRRLPEWPYNLFCMIHGKQRERVLAHLDNIVALEGLQSIPHRVLFSGRRFKQRGARYR